MTTLGRRSRRHNRRRLEQEIIEKALDYPYALWNEGFDTYRLGRPEDHLFLADLRDPITMTGAEVTERYKMPFDATYTKLVLYQTDAAGAEVDDALNLRLNLLHPNGTPEVLYNKQGVSWPSGGERLTGHTYMPASELQVIHEGTLNNLLYVSLELVVHNIA
jgi:hypothetical protein